MPKLLVFLLAACTLIASGKATQAVAGSSEDRMPRDRAEATFKDPRVQSFLKKVKDGFNASCALPDFANTKAKITLPNIPPDAPPGAADMASTWYEVAVPCTGDATVTVKAEFTGLTGPLNLVLSLSQTLKM